MPGKQHPILTVDDLRTGRVARATEVDTARILGVSPYTLQRDRSKKASGALLFQKDEKGRIWYAAADILAEIDRPKHEGTNEYDTSEQLQRLEKAREKAREARSERSQQAS